MQKKLHLLCSKDELRPVLMHVYYTGSQFVAANCYAIGVVNTDLEFGDNPILIHRDHWKKLTKVKSENLLIDHELKTITSIDKNAVVLDIIPFIYEGENDLKYPDVEAVFQSKVPAFIEKIAVNGVLLGDVCKALGINSARLEFTGETKHIFVFDNDDLNPVKGLIMPQLIN